MTTVKYQQGQVFPDWATHMGTYYKNTFWIGANGYLYTMNDHGTDGSMIKFSDDRAIQLSDFQNIKQKEDIIIKQESNKPNILSADAESLITHMIKEISSMKYFYQSIADGCYDASINNFGMNKPVECKSTIVNLVIKQLNDRYIK